MLFAAIALVLGLVIALALVEVILRIFDPIGMAYEKETLTYFQTAIHFDWLGLPAEPGQIPEKLDLDGRLFIHKPNHQGEYGSFELRTNALGLRGPDVAIPKPENTFRIVLLGDSVAFGWGVDDEVTFARRLETEWNAAHEGVRLEVVNTAHPKYDTNQEAAMMRRLGRRLKPDLVLLVYVTNDLADPSRDVVEELITGRHPHPEERVVLGHDAWSWLAETVQPVLPATAALLGTRSDHNERMRAALAPGQTYAPETWGAGPRGWERSKKALLEIRDLCAALDTPFVLFDHTMPAVASLPPFCEENGIAYEPFRFREEDFAKGITNSTLDSHANALGHEILLQRMRTALERRELLPEPGR